MNNQQEKALPGAPPKCTPTTKRTKTTTINSGIDLRTTAAAGDKTDAGLCFELVLIDMIASVESKKFITVKKNMYDTKYACISYRWGEVPEQIVMTPDYNAHITSFDLQDLMIVCQQILFWSADSNDLDDDDDDAATVEDVPFDPHSYPEHTIPYLWVDAISVDQMDSVHKKTTIHRMTDIYNYSQVILAVPDLHRGYLTRMPPMNACLATISKYGNKIFRHVAQRCWQTEEEEKAALDKDNWEDVSEEGQDDQVDDDDDDDEEEATVIDVDTNSIDLPRKHRGFRQILKDSVSRQPSEDATQTNDNEEDDNEEVLDDEEEDVCTCMDDLDEDDVSAFEDALTFVDWLVQDWSSRVWVISEYSIGRRMKMKLWFLSIGYSNLDNRPNELLNMFDPREPNLYDTQLQERTFLDMMLNSNATRNEDRFYAVLPLFRQYKHFAANHTISSWGITDMVTVRLRLYQMVTFEEKLTMLLCSVDSSYQSDVILPSFTTFYLQVDFDWATELSMAPALMTSIDLVPGDAVDDRRRRQQPYLAVTVPWTRTFTGSTVQHDLSVARHALTRLGLSDLLDELVTVFVPITIHNEQTQRPLGVKLIGHRGLNKWIMLHRMVDLIDVPPTPTSGEVGSKKLPHPPHRSASLDTLWSDKVEKEQVFYIY